MDEKEIGLREQKKRALRAQLSDTATAMFSKSGFANVRVEDIATACGVTPKTLYSYFPTKESLLFERGTALAAVLNAPHRDSHALFDAVLASIRHEINELTSDTTGDVATASGDAIQTVQAFVALVGSAPTLRAAAADQLEGLTERAASVLSSLNGLSQQSPENQVAAAALITLWRVHLSGLLTHPNAGRTLQDVQHALLSDVNRSAELLRPVFDQIERHTTRHVEQVR